MQESHTGKLLLWFRCDVKKMLHTSRCSDYVRSLNRHACIMINSWRWNQGHFPSSNFLMLRIYEENVNTRPCRPGHDVSKALQRKMQQRVEQKQIVNRTRVKRFQIYATKRWANYSSYLSIELHCRSPNNIYFACVGHLRFGFSS